MVDSRPIHREDHCRTRTRRPSSARHPGQHRVPVPHANLDADGRPLDGAKTYRLALPQDIPAARIWSLTLYDNQTRSMLQTSHRFPRAGSQRYPSPAAEAEPDGSTAVYFAPTRPDHVVPGNWIQTDRKKGWFTILRLYGPPPALLREDLATRRDRAQRLSQTER